MPNCLDGKPYAPSKSTHTQQAYLSPGRTMEFSRLSLFGMTFAHLTGARGEDVLTWYLAGFHVKTSALLARDMESRESVADYGWRWHESSMKYDRLSCSWKTRQDSLFGGSETFSGRWPRWGTMRDGECWELPTLAPQLKERESGYLPSPTKSMGKKGIGQSLDGKNRFGMKQSRIARRIISALGWRQPPDALEWVMGWPIGWTGLQPLEMDKSRSAWRSLGNCCRDD